MSNPAVVSGPGAEPVSVTEAKTHLRVDSSDEDTLVGSLVIAARQYVERTIGKALVFQTLDYSLDAFPCGDRILLPMAPLRSVSSVTYHDDDLSTSTVFSSSSYQTDRATDPPAVVLKNGVAWPTDSLRLSSGVVVRYKAGYAMPFTAEADDDTITATGHPYSNGDVVRVVNTGGALPTGLSAGTDYYVVGATTNTLQLSATSGGSAINVTADGTGTNFLGEVPEPIRSAIKLLVGQMFRFREPQVTGTIISDVGFALDALLAPFTDFRTY